MLLALAFGVAGQGRAHGGGLDANGCHHDRKNGGYHCHRAPAAAQAPGTRLAPSSSFAPSRTAPRTQQTGGWSFRNCTEARAAGRAPIRRGEPGYGPHLDRDNDGIACEPYKGR
ncbi:MAG: excalibur calcium-binding domain-containing protein [Proteobacteria bacterium]|nr:excalibur calcium-binding domain-containing protein [Pseudomonadota bacterium]MCA0395557.1 excalibur calcium-binding domain-containing protein [Pseudomonadota bacterium]